METSRARLRRPQSTDFDRMRALESDPAIMRFTPARVQQTPEQTRARLESQLQQQSGHEPFGIWLAEEKDSGALIGWFMLRPSAGAPLELGFMLVQAQWGRGYATEVGEALLAFARKVGVEHIVAKTTVDNAPSMRVLEKLGFRPVGTTSIASREGEAETKINLFEKTFR